ncbi:protein FLX-like 4 [Durio zibethinus]|uniref:Protein FLX-like 4 n=1 Tax=Durio zibethinus TaxID=66656 RepID=A0A6P5Z9P2_DURZI|nr:protein FLX-like 4 [Durio zibethinus]XP_022749461.1 protein FLX-like 4 [Durio zibethinus]XP_022749462.1 protein FLX-like 4 [Durio zibethinus]XP_022749463.1 protein FLX-like 4 [Durio zibethinus]XP_022749464.1 protein FLX-like 4 [Durio zibethinus]XP_022749465.1 protein FLX-like 4 [Durio zibethinus]XP_022749466.1 protein FLX-like 4 [Durio zibethinus]
MASRKIRSACEGRSIQASGVIRHGPLAGPGSAAHRAWEPLPPPELLENKIASQAAEIEQLVGDKHRLAASHVALSEDLVAARHEAQRLKEHIKSIQIESDIQIRVLQEKIVKMEADIRVGDSVKKELQQVHIEAQNLVKARQELVTQIGQASQELLKTQADAKSLPELHAELEGLRKEHQKLRVTFQYEKGSNIEQVEQMQAMEKELIGMAREVEKLRAEVLSAEKKVHAPIGPVPYAAGYMNPNRSYIPPFQGSSTYFDGYGQPIMQMGLGPAEGMIPYGNSANVPTATAATGIQTVPGSVWGAPYDPSLAQR